MDQENTNVTARDVHELGGKSWTAYIWTGIFAIILLAVSVVAFVGNILAGLIVLTLCTLCLLYTSPSPRD